MDEVAKPGWLTGFFGSGGNKSPAPQATPKRSTKPALHQPPSVRSASTQFAHSSSTTSTVELECFTATHEGL
jgi:hypothetical protein